MVIRRVGEEIIEANQVGKNDMAAFARRTKRKRKVIWSFVRVEYSQVAFCSE